jgi:PAS domain S-box-containing protein
MAVFGVLMDIAMGILMLIGREAWDLAIGLLVAIFVLTGIGVFFFDRYVTASVMRRFSQLSDPPPGSEDEQCEEFEDLKLTTTQTHALFYLNFAVTVHEMRIFEFSFMKYMAVHFRTPAVLTHCARLISWLPSSARPLNFLCAEAAARRDLGTDERFILFQLQRIRLLRESSTSTTAVEKLASVKTASTETAAMMRAFWDRSECDLSLLNRFALQISSTNSLWDEGLEDFPNSTQFRDLYITYLIEGATRFSDAIFQKSRSDMLENGADFRVDNCFRRFVRRFPEYLKRGIVDGKGNSLIKGMGPRASPAGGSANEASEGVLDIAVEEGIARTLIRHSRVRLTVERAFVDRRPGAFRGIVYATVIALALCVASFIFVMVYFSSYFDERTAVTDRIAQQTSARFLMVSSIYAWLYQWGGNVSALSDHYMTVLAPLDGPDRTPFFEEGVPWEKDAIRFNVMARRAYEALARSVMEMADSGVDVFRYAARLFDPNAMPLKFCTEDGHPTDYIWYGNVRAVWTYYFVQTSLFHVVEFNDWFKKGNEALCVVLGSIAGTMQPLTDFRIELASMADDASDTASDLLAPLRFALPIGLFVISMVLYGVGSFMYIKEVNHLTSLLLNLPKTVKRECAKTLRIDGSRDDSATAGATTVLASSGINIPVAFNIVIAVVLAGGSVVLFAQALNLEYYNELYSRLNHWVVQARARKCYVMESLVGAILAVLHFAPQTNGTYINETEMVSMARTGRLRIIELGQELFEPADSSGVPSVVGFDPEIDALSLSPICQPDINDQSLHEYYRCSSTAQLLDYHINSIGEAILNPQVYVGRIDGTTRFGQLAHLISIHLVPALLRVDDVFGGLSVKVRDQFVNSHEMYSGIEIALMAIVAIVFVIYCRVINGCYDVLLALLRRIAPANILASEPLEAYLLNKSTGKRREGLTAEERIVDSSADSIICMSSTGVIDQINPAVTKTFGYTPEQLLGQLLFSLLTPDQAEPIGGQLKLMGDRQSAPLYEGHTTCVTDDEKVVPCSISLLAIFDGEELSSFVAILKNESALLAQQQEAEVAKRQSETLLYQILPRDIVTRLNAGEKDISFSISSATIMFIDIVKFSAYAADLTPQDMMGNLSLIFCGFDEACSKYPLLMKIKLIGDVYMAAGGLFTPDIAPVAHAEQMVHLAIDALQVIEETNVKLSALLAVRSGINTGGPILAGVLGTDKPAFDIIGDPINIAARLQSTDVPGKIQISEKTRGLVAAMDVLIEDRGEIELKGKGKTTTFLIDPSKEALAVRLSTSLEEFARFVPGESARPK